MFNQPPRLAHQPGFENHWWDNPPAPCRSSLLEAAVLNAAKLSSCAAPLLVVQVAVASLCCLLFRTALSFFSLTFSPLSPLQRPYPPHIIRPLAPTPLKVGHSCHHDALRACFSSPCHESIHALVSLRCPGVPSLTHPHPHPSPVETLAVAGEESGLQALGLGWALRGTHSALYPSELQTVKVPN